MLHLFCASPLNIESEMIFTPFCLSKATSSYEYELVNLMDSSTVSNDTQITTGIPAMSFSSDKKSINYQGEIFIFNCPMSVNDADFFTQVIHWLEQDTSTNIVNGKEYISSENGKKIHLFEVERPLKERYEIGGEFRNFNIKSARTWVAIGLLGLKIHTGYKYKRGSAILRKLAELQELKGGALMSRGDYRWYKLDALQELNEMYPNSNLENLGQTELDNLINDLTKLAKNEGGFIENVKSLYSPLQAMNRIKTALKTAKKNVQAEVGRSTVTQAKDNQSTRGYTLTEEQLLEIDNKAQEVFYDSDMDFFFDVEDVTEEGELKDKSMNFLMQLLDYIKKLIPK